MNIFKYRIKDILINTTLVKDLELLKDELLIQNRDLITEVQGYKEAYESLSSGNKHLVKQFNKLRIEADDLMEENVSLASEIKSNQRQIHEMEKEIGEFKSNRKTSSTVSRKPNKNSRKKNTKFSTKK